MPRLDERCDVVVVGAGPAGASVALQLARRGAHTIVIERARMPRTKVCGEYLSPSTLESLDELGLLDAVRKRAHVLASLSIAGFGIGPVKMRLPGLGGLALERARFDLLLADAAAAAGAIVVTGTFVGATPAADGVRVTYRDADGEDRDVSAGVLVGADGSHSAVARRCGLADERPRAGRWAVGGHEHAPSDSDEIEMFVGREGYYARNPLGGGLTNVMLVMPRPLLDEAAEATVRALSAGRCAFELKNLVRRVAVGPLRYRARAPIRGRIILAGDAAELLDPFLGQGIALALKLSASATDAAVRLIAGERPDAVARRYAAARASAVRRVRIIGRAVDALLRVGWLRGRAARKLAQRPELADQLLDAIAGSATDGRRLALAWDLIA